MRYMKISFFLMATSVSTFSAEEQITAGGSDFPGSVAGAPWVQATNFAADGGPGGIAVSYRASKLKADIYVFDAGDPSWTGKSLDERFVLEATSIPGVLKEIERRGIYTDVKIGGAGDAKAGALSFTHLRAAYSEKGEKRKSHYYLAKYRGRLLKIRITAWDDVDDVILEKAFKDAVASFNKA